MSAPSQIRESTLQDEHLSVSADESKAKNTLNICTQNVVSYMAGYVLRRIPFSCSKCHSKFTVLNLSDNELTTEFLKAKTYRATGTLIYPSLCFVSLIETFETVFVNHFPHIVHMEKVLMRLVMYAEPYCEGVADCDSLICKQKLVCVARLFMKVRFIHAIK